MTPQEKCLLQRLHSATLDMAFSYFSSTSPGVTLIEALAASSFEAVLDLFRTDNQIAVSSVRSSQSHTLDKYRMLLESRVCGNLMRTKTLPSWSRWLSLWESGRPLPDEASDCILTAIQTPGLLRSKTCILHAMERISDYDSDKETSQRTPRRKALLERLVDIKEALKIKKVNQKRKTWLERGGIVKRLSKRRSST